MKRPGYREAIFWLANNDDIEWVGEDGDDPNDAMRSPSVTACLVADLFGVDTERVRVDVRREHRRPAWRRDFVRNPPRYFAWLVAPGVGVLNGCGFADRKAAATCLADRKANGEAFPGERVARVPRRVIFSCHVRGVNA